MSKHSLHASGIRVKFAVPAKGLGTFDWPLTLEQTAILAPFVAFFLGFAIGALSMIGGAL
jgi:hypothetical protein